MTIESKQSSSPSPHPSKVAELSHFPNPQDYEGRIYQFWQDGEFFQVTSGDHRQGSPPIYTILMPPPNVTSQLHMGHGAGYSIQDWLIRWRRMKDGQAAWIPGLDHAGIATQMMVEKQLQAEGISKHSLGRDLFVKRAQQWKEKYGHEILNQFRAIGFSCDWSRLAYTLDNKRSYAVRYAFVQLFNEGLIYRSHRLVNWDPSLQTALGDDEVENRMVSGHIFYLRYPVKGGDAGQWLTVATTRPETMFGDVAVAVHPDDERFQQYHGKKVILPLTHREIPVITDNYVKQDFGTGVLKITPAHDPNDYLVGVRHGLGAIDILNDQGALQGDDVPKSFQGVDRFAARKMVVKSLKELGLFQGSDPHKHSVPYSSRSGVVIEPKLCAQWYVKMSGFAKQAATVVRQGEMSFYPENWQKTWLYWLDNIQDWCISRQLWWGHRIPVWTCENCGHVFASLEDQPHRCPKCDGQTFSQDPDVLDTWFSSWLWPLSPFGWPDDSNELDDFFPSQVLITAPDIIFQWVARMTMASLKFQKKLPFKKVFFVATVCDKKGQKFSKTLGNGIDPMDVIAEYGADALRFTAAFIAPQGGRIKMSMDDFNIGKNFIHKIWHASRFILGLCDNTSNIKPLASTTKNVWQLGLLTELAYTIDKTEDCLNNFQTQAALRTLYHYVWHALCDWGIEACKESFRMLSADDQEKKEECLSVILFAHECALRLMHPVIPFVTEELWGHLPAHPDLPRAKALCVSKYPSLTEVPSEPRVHEKWTLMQNIIQKIRRLKQVYSLPKQSYATLNVYLKIMANHRFEDQEELALITRLAQVGIVHLLSPQDTMPAKSLIDGTLYFEVAVEVGDLIDISAEVTRLSAQIKQAQGHLGGVEKKLQSEAFLARASESVVTNTKKQKQQLLEKIGSLEKTYESLLNAQDGGL
ncbi:MAG: valine--tRNA ligase [Proteobacteria bacterium]|nr:valine--tRNA ligase [Pseudomonadota bacterium]